MIAFGDAELEKEVLACVAGSAADVDATHRYTSDRSKIRFLLTLYKQDSVIAAVERKFRGMMAGMPPERFSCIANEAANIYACHNGTGTIWYYPARRHGIEASLNVAALITDDRANKGEIYNFTCADF